MKTRAILKFDAIRYDWIKNRALPWLHRSPSTCIELATCHRSRHIVWIECENVSFIRSHTLPIKEQKWMELLTLMKWRVKLEVIMFMEAVRNPKSVISYWLIEKCQTKTTSLQWLFMKSLASMGRKLLDIYQWNSAELQPIFVENGGEISCKVTRKKEAL